MLFSEIYGSYYNAVSKLIACAVDGDLTKEKMYEIVDKYAFAESGVSIPTAIKSGEWNLITEDMKTPIKNKPSMPITLLEKRWLKSVLDDPRVKLFDINADALKGIEPLYSSDMFDYYDRFADGDDYKNPEYIKIFRLILTAIRKNHKLLIRFTSHKDFQYSIKVIPHRLEYSEKDDKFRLICVNSHHTYTVNLSRITFCKLLEKYKPFEDKKERCATGTLVLELTDEKNALERVMHEFSYLKKGTERLSDNKYRISLEYDKGDGTEILIRVLSFGTRVKVISPQSLINELKNRINKQKSCGLF